MSWRQWRRLADRLAPAYRVVAPDFLGSGENPTWPADEPFDFHMDVAAIEELAADLGGRVHVVGHSYGGLVALMFARKNPGMIRSLAVFDPVAFGVLHDAQDTEGLADLAAGSDPMLSDPSVGGNEAWLNHFIDYWSGPGAWRALPPATRESFLRIGKKVYREVQSLLLDRTPRAGYAGVQAPTLLLHGEKSPPAARRVVTLLAGSIPNATLQTVAGAGHMGPITHGGAVNDLIAQHIERAS